LAKFRIRLKVQGLELEVDGEREDIPVIARAVQQQFAGMLEPITVAAEVPRLSTRSENADGDGASGKRSPRRRNRSSTEGETTPIEYRHDDARFGNPLQTWTVTDKCIWMLYALKAWHWTQGSVRTSVGWRV
jgi:hypothetical protein